MTRTIAKKVMHKPKKIVYMSISGGVVYCHSVPKGVIVKVLDYDVTECFGTQEMEEREDCFVDEDGDYYSETVYEQNNLNGLRTKQPLVR